MACLDTTFLVDLARTRPSPAGERARAKRRQLADRGEPLLTTRFNVAELYVGLWRAPDVAREERAVAAILHGMGILEFDDRAARLFGRITARLQRLGRPAGDMDVLIGATALAADALFITRNAEHFADIPGLRVETY